MREPEASRPYWPDALQNAPAGSAGLKKWPWATQRLAESHNYWIATCTPDRRPHLMLVWGIWHDDAFWFCTGARTRKARNLAAGPHCVIGTQDSSEAVILEGRAQSIREKKIIREFVSRYDKKYGGDVGELVNDSSSIVFRVQPEKVFGLDEHAENFIGAATRWQFQPGEAAEGRKRTSPSRNDT